MTIGRRYFALRNVLLLGASVVGAFSPTELFAAGEQGVWYDPSDFSTMFQDAAGTTPVTAVEQYVGKILDKSGRGNHATQSTETSCPLLSARVNLLTRSQEFDHTDWTKGGLTVSATKVTAPDGTTTAQTLVWASGSGPQLTRVAASVTAGTPLIYSVYAKAGTKSSVTLILFTDGSNYISCSFNLATGAKGTPTTEGSQYSSTACTMTLDSNDFYRCVLTANTTTLTSVQSWVRGDTMAGSGDTIVVWGADLRASNEGPGLPVYQRVSTSTDYDAGDLWPKYLRFDGADDKLVTSAISWPGAYSAWAAIRPSIISGVHSIVDADPTGGTRVPQYLRIYAGSPESICFSSGGVFSDTGPSVSANRSYVFSVNCAASIDVRVNEVSNGAASVTGTLNAASHPLAIGSNPAVSAFFGGRIYAAIVRGSNSTAAQIASTEAWLNAKTKAYAA